MGYPINLAVRTPNNHKTVSHTTPLELNTRCNKVHAAVARNNRKHVWHTTEQQGTRQNNTQEVLSAAAAAVGSGSGAGAAGPAQRRPRGRSGRTQHDAPDEIAEYETGRYVGASEAACHILGVQRHSQYPPVMRLPLHLPDQQPVVFNDDESAQQLAARVAEPEDTMLTAWFVANQQHPKARELRYDQMPQHFKFVNHRWEPRKPGAHGRAQNPSLARVYAAHPAQRELFHLRILLNHRKNVTSWEQLRTTPGHAQPCATFNDAAKQLGVLQTDDEWVAALREAARDRMPVQVRQLFGLLLAHCDVSDPGALWAQFLPDLTEDILHEERQRLQDPSLQLTVAMQHEALRHVEAVLQANGRELSQFAGMPQPEPPPGTPEQRANRLVREQLDLATAEQAAQAAASRALMNDEQAQHFEEVMRSVRQPATGEHGSVFFLDSPAGCGKTRVMNAVAAAARALGRIVLTVASSGVASLLLEGGSTAHARFRIPLQIAEDSVCSVAPKSLLGELLRETHVIIWDEAPMTHRHAFEAVDKMLRDVCRTLPVPDGTLAAEHPSELPFAGKVVLLGGDFRQVLPVIRHGTRGDAVDACLKRSPLWQHVRVLHLITNMRVHVLRQRPGVAPEQQQRMTDFAAWLLQLGEGAQGEHVRLPDHVCAPAASELSDLIATVFGDLQNDPAARTDEQLVKRAILTPLNETVDQINLLVLDQLEGDARTYLSADAVCANDDAAAFPEELLNRLNVPGLPPHELTLKVGMPVLLLRNLNSRAGLMNGTRLIVTALGRYRVQARIATGARNVRGKVVLIPRIPLSDANAVLPFTLVRRQFPLRPAFGMTINKAQGQTLERVGVYLPQPCFAHGQLYVACSRVGDPACLTVLATGADGAPREGEAPGVYATNVVWKEALA